jgi:hypothetical protein
VVEGRRAWSLRATASGSQRSATSGPRLRGLESPSLRQEKWGVAR